jgi:hypothetical protein
MGFHDKSKEMKDLNLLILIYQWLSLLVSIAIYFIAIHNDEKSGRKLRSFIITACIVCLMIFFDNTDVFISVSLLIAVIAIDWKGVSFKNVLKNRI